MKSSVLAALLCAAAAACPACGGLSTTSEPAATPAAPVSLGQLPTPDVDLVLEHTKTLSSDAFQGRAPGTKGETTTVAYLVDQFKKVGLKPGNPDGTYIQKVPLVGITPTPAPLVVRKGNRTET